MYFYAHRIFITLLICSTITAHLFCMQKFIGPLTKIAFRKAQKRETAQLWSHAKKIVLPSLGRKEPITEKDILHKLIARHIVQRTSHIMHELCNHASIPYARSIYLNELDKMVKYVLDTRKKNPRWVAINHLLSPSLFHAHEALADKMKGYHDFNFFSNTGIYNTIEAITLLSQCSEDSAGNNVLHILTKELCEHEDISLDWFNVIYKFDEQELQKMVNKKAWLNRESPLDIAKKYSSDYKGYPMVYLRFKAILDILGHIEKYGKLPYPLC